MQTHLTVNGKSVTVEAAPNTLLVQALREHLHLTGTHVGCDTAQCGACTVIVNGDAVKSCNMLLAQAADAQITTIEGLAHRSMALKTMPGVQKPHCRPWHSLNAACIGCMVPSGAASPSMVVMEAPSA